MYDEARHGTLTVRRVSHVYEPGTGLRAGHPELAPQVDEGPFHTLPSK